MSDNETTKPPRKTAAAAGKPKAAKKPAKAAAAIDIARIRTLAAEISAMGGQDLSDLQARYAIEEGLKLTTEGALVTAQMHGVSVTAYGDVRRAMINWANAARRVANRAGPA